MKKLLILFLSSLSVNYVTAQNKPELILPTGPLNISKVNFHPSEKYVSTHGENFLVWSLKTEKLVREIGEKDGYIFKWDNMGMRVLSGDKGRKILYITKSSSADTLHRLKGHTSKIIYTMWSPDGSRIVSVDEDQNVITWNTVDGSIIEQNAEKEFPEGFSSLTQSLVSTSKNEKGERQLVVTSMDGNKKQFPIVEGQILLPENTEKAVIYFEIGYENDGIAIYDLKTGKKTKTYEKVRAVSENGNYIAIVKKEKLSVIDVGTGKKIYKQSSYGFTSIEKAIISPDGKKMATTYSFQRVHSSGYCSEYKHQNILRIYDLVTGEIIIENLDARSTIDMLNWNQKSDMLAVSDKGNVTKIWDVKQKKVISNLSGLISGDINLLSISPDKKTLAVALKGRNNFGDNIKTFNLNEGKLLRNFKDHCYTINTLEWSPNGEKIGSGSMEGRAIIWNAEWGLKLQEITLREEAEINKIVWTPDGKSIITASGGNGTAYRAGLNMWDAETGKNIRKLSTSGTQNRDIALSPNGMRFAAQGINKEINTWNIKNVSMAETFRGLTNDAMELKWTKDGKYIIAYGYGLELCVWQASNGKLVKKFDLDWAGYDLNKDETKIIIHHFQENAVIYELATGKELFSLPTFTNNLSSSWSNDDSLIYQYSIDETKYWDVTKGKYIEKAGNHPSTAISGVQLERFNISFKEHYISIDDKYTDSNLLRIYPFDTLGYMVLTPDNYYTGSIDILKKLNFKLQGKIYGFDQFDLKYNRPDIIAERLGQSDKNTVLAYRKAYEKRLKKLGFTEEMLKDDYHLPELKIKNIDQIPNETDSADINLKLEMHDSKYELDRINIYLNNVPIYGVNGINLREFHSGSSENNVKIRLAEGENHLQISVLNSAGAESYKENIYITHNPITAHKPELFIITIGDSKYADSRYDLTYASKDADDIRKAFENIHSGIFENIHAFTLTDASVTRENVRQLKNELFRANRNDVVLISVSGHGVLDKNLDYYLATFDMDFSNPSEKGLPYEELESLLDGIPPLKKAMFIDACHSGEVDKEEVEVMASMVKKDSKVKFRSAGAGLQSKNLGLKSTSELMGEMFTDLRKGTGATVISSAGGGEYAMESPEWKNGLFTYCLLNGLKSKSADKNKDGIIMLSELQSLLQNDVTILSKGAQKPTSRIENLSMDFRVW